MKTYLIVGAVLLVLLAVTLYSAQVWLEFDEGQLSGHGLVALLLGIVITLVVGCGLMALVFYSSRRGYDDRGAGEP
jgi:uncharacterized integral membrane protein